MSTIAGRVSSAGWSARRMARAVGSGVTKFTSSFSFSPSAKHFARLWPWQVFTPPRSDTPSLLELYRTSPWVRSVVGKVASSVASVHWYIDQDGERIDDHELLAFLKRGSQFMPGAIALRVMQAHIDLAGEAFMAIGRTAQGVPHTWLPLAPHWINDVAREPGQQWIVSPNNGHTLHIDFEDIIWIRDADPKDPTNRGSSITAALATDVESDKQAAEFVSHFFQNRARPDLIITGTEKHELTEDQATRLRKTWSSRFGGIKNVVKPFISTRPIEVTEVSQSMSDSQMTELRSHIRDIVFQVYGVPPEIFGQLDSSNKATIQHALEMFARFTLNPRLELLLTYFECYLAPMFKGFEEGGPLKLQFENPVKEDRELQLKVMDKFKGDFSRNEVRAIAGLAPVDDGDEIAPNDERFSISNPVEPDDDDEDDEDKDDDEVDDEDKDNEDKSARPRNRGLGLDDIIDVSGAHEDPIVVASVQNIVEPLYLDLLASVGADVVSDISDELAFELNTAVREWGQRQVASMIGHINTTTRRVLRDKLLDAVANAASQAELRRIVEDVFDDAQGHRAIMIAATESTAITGFASMTGIEQAGIEGRVWLDSGDHKVRGTHQALDGQIKQTGEPFVSPSGDQALHPGGFTTAEENINCRCAIRAALPGELTDAEIATAKDAYHRALDAGAAKLHSRIKDVFDLQRAIVIAALNDRQE